MRLMRALATASGGLLLLTGCAGSDSAAGPTTSAGGRTPATTTSASATLPQSADLVARARKTFLTAPLARYQGRITRTGEVLSVDMTSDTLGNGTGSIDMGSAQGKAMVTVIGEKIYLAGDKRFWTSSAGAEAARTFRGKWIAAGASRSEFSDMADLLDRGELTENLFEDVRRGKVTVGRDGATWSVTNPAGTLVVDRASGRPVSLEVADGTSQASLRFTYPKGAITPPPRNKVVAID